MIENWHNNELQKGLGSYDSPMDLEGVWSDLDSKRNPKKKRRVIFFLGLIACGVALLSAGVFLVRPSTSPVLVEDSLKVSDIDLFALDHSKGKELESDLMTEKVSSASLVINETTSSKDLNTPSKDQDVRAPIAPLTHRAILVDKYTVNQETDLKQSSNFKILEKKPSIINPNFVLTKNKLSKAFFIPALATNEFYFERKIKLENPIPSFKILPLDKNVNEKFAIGLVSSYSLWTTGALAQEESPLDAMSSLVFLELAIKDRFYLKTGIAFQQFTTEINEVLERNFFVEENVVIANNSFLNGNFEEISEDVLVEYVETSDYQIYNHYRMINIPILLGYNLSRDRSNFLIEAGMSSSIFNLHEGDLVQGDALRSFDKSTSFKSRNFGSLQVLGGLYYQRNIGERFSIIAGSQYTYELNQAFKNIAERRKRFSALELSLGGKMKL